MILEVQVDAASGKTCRCAACSRAGRYVHTLRPLRDRLLAKVVFTPTGCWEFTGARDRQGYGRLMGLDQVTRFAHRLSYELFVGPIPDGLQIDHLCNNPPCVSPAHLRPATARQNTLRSQSPSALRARQTHCKRGHAFDRINTYIDPLGRRNCRACGREWARARARGGAA